MPKIPCASSHALLQPRPSYTTPTRVAKYSPSLPCVKFMDYGGSSWPLQARSARPHRHRRKQPVRFRPRLVKQGHRNSAECSWAAAYTMHAMPRSQPAPYRALLCTHRPRPYGTLARPSLATRSTCMMRMHEASREAPAGSTSAELRTVD